MGNNIKKHIPEVLNPVITPETLKSLHEQSEINKFNKTKEILYNIDARELIKNACKDNRTRVDIISNGWTYKLEHNRRTNKLKHHIECSHLEDLFPEYLKYFNGILKINVPLKFQKFENQGRFRSDTHVSYIAEW